MSIFDKYDLIDVDESIKIPKKPKKGLILLVGSSGTGKTSILKSWGMKQEKINPDIPIYKLFKSEQEAEKFLLLAGLGSIPCWKRPMSSVSNGECHRAKIALHLSTNSAYIDEFTSLVDRNTARSLCHKINKLKPPHLVLATCHKDVLEWLDYDYAYDTDLSQWLEGRLVHPVRNISISLRPADPKKVWEVFKRHHYLSKSINRCCNCWVGIYKNKHIAMTSVIAFPNGYIKKAWREHRTVVLPEFQGMGIGTAISDNIANHIVTQGYRFFSKTAHPAFGMHREKSDNWIPTGRNKKCRLDYKCNTKTKEDAHKLQHAHRICFSHEYILI